MTVLLHPGARLVDAGTGEALSGACLRDRLDASARALEALPPGLMLALTPTELPAVLAYAAAVQTGRPIALLDPRLPAATLHDYLKRFEPALVTGLAAGADLGEPPAPYEAVEDPALGPLWRRTAPAGAAPHADLALLLTTSGSTGSGKVVRLSGRSVLANADAIADALHIDDREVAVTTLPLFYTYGLSVLNSHLRRGATVVLERTGPLHRDFWKAVTAHEVTSLAAVPYQYQMLRRMGFKPAGYPRLRTLTQAGGRLANELILDFHGRMAEVGGRLYVMYGQTEATARIAVLPPDRLPEKIGSVGLPVPGGRIEILGPDGTTTTAAAVTGEVVYAGPNVMMGYGESAADLARPDEQGGVLHTGDLGHLDADGFLFLTGRHKRIAKVFGARVNLDDVERMLAGHGPVAVVGRDDRLVVFVEAADDERRDTIARELAASLSTHRSGIQVHGVDPLPLTANGKVDYRALEAYG